MPMDRLADLAISIHVPREGDDNVRYDATENLTISIHVPREGDDILRPCLLIAKNNFNPRPP